MSPSYFPNPYPYVSDPLHPPAPGSLMAWTQTHFNGLFLATTDAARDAAMAAALSPNISAIVNGGTHTGADIEAAIVVQREGIRAHNGITLQWENALELVDSGSGDQPVRSSARVSIPWHDH